MAEVELPARPQTDKFQASSSKQISRTEQPNFKPRILKFGDSLAVGSCEEITTKGTKSTKKKVLEEVLWHLGRGGISDDPRPASIISRDKIPAFFVLFVCFVVFPAFSLHTAKE